jgi:hypothetical protein
MDLKVEFTRKRKEDLNRLINAIGFLSHVFPGEFVSPCPAASTNLSEFTPPAFSLIAIGVAKILENVRFHPDLLKRFFSHVSAIQFEIAAGLNLTHMGDETE